MYKCWLTFIESYTLVSYRTVEMLIDTWYHKQENMKVWKVICKPK